MQIINLRSIQNLDVIARKLDHDEARRAGIYITEKELKYYVASPWIEAFVMLSGKDFGGFSSFNTSEKVWGRIQWQEFYLAPRFRHRMLGYRFYKELLKLYKGCQGIRAYVRTTNKTMVSILRDLGWKEECVIRHFDREGKTYYQMRARELTNG